MDSPHDPPADVTRLARERADARRARDFERADQLRAAIEAAGWKVVDEGRSFALLPAAPPTVEVDGIPRYGAAAAVPSVLEAPPDLSATVILVAEDAPGDLAGVLAGLRAHAPGGTQVVIVANDPLAGQGARLAAGEADLSPVGGLEPEVTWTSSRLGAAAALNVGIRRARGRVVVLAKPAVTVSGDPISPLVAAFDDPDVAVAGPFGRVAPTGDLRSFVLSDGPDVHVISGEWLAARRDDMRALGDPSPLDEHFAVPAHLDTWLSLALRTLGEDDGDERARPARRARVTPLPVARMPLPGAADAGADKRARRNFYRLLDAYRGRADLLNGDR